MAFDGAWQTGRFAQVWALCSSRPEVALTDWLNIIIIINVDWSVGESNSTATTREFANRISVSLLLFHVRQFSVVLVFNFAKFRILTGALELLGSSFSLSVQVQAKCGFADDGYIYMSLTLVCNAKWWKSDDPTDGEKYLSTDDKYKCCSVVNSGLLANTLFWLAFSTTAPLWPFCVSLCLQSCLNLPLSVGHQWVTHRGSSTFSLPFSFVVLLLSMSTTLQTQLKYSTCPVSSLSTSYWAAFFS